MRRRKVEANVSRKVINRRAGYEALRTLAGLRWGARSAPRETEPITTVERARVVATLPFLDTHLRAMVEVQFLTETRPGAVCLLRLCEVDRAGDVWAHRPRHHKTAHHDRPRPVLIGPKAQAALVGFQLRTGAPPIGFEISGDTARLVMADAYQEAGRERDAALLRDLKRPVETVAGCVVDPEATLFSPAEARGALRGKAGQAQKYRSAVAVGPAQERSVAGARERVPAHHIRPCGSAGG
ncbi:hypothetical protein VT84_23285 [Gemmata sp. SH-PL17]|uniref:hypothetical protein n=1 Tax=Gemmata sp. SH-PL17 TaxID=1630693 RepID=UPI00078C65B0|nr:hypothetical protein [Gemmata sp. SH-PL17]AMV27343.1 hypothetical protein VT84_23285 [Gemmata sp. SH-PL17]